MNANETGAMLGICLVVAQATRLFCPATRRTAGAVIQANGDGLSRLCLPDFRSASRRPGRAGRPRHPFSKQALSGDQR